MKKPISVVLLLAALVLAGLAASPAYGGSDQGRAGEAVPDSYIVVLQEGASASDVISDHGVARKHTYKAVFNGFSGKVPPGRVQALRNDPRVASVSVNRRVQANPKPDAPGGGKGGGGKGNKPPTVSIIAPSDGATAGSGASIAFAGSASDKEDKDVTASLIWISSIDGEIGVGGSFSAILSDGAQTVTATATDSQGKTGNDSISITVGTGPTPTPEPTPGPTPEPTPTSTPTPPPSNQTVPSGVQRIGAAGLAYDGAGVGVAIVDSGIDFAHADLVVASQCFTAFTGCQDDAGHGTHVAGIVAAQDNNIDVLGVAPGVTLYAVKVLNSQGSGTDAEVIAGLNWVKDQAQAASPPIRVVNMSLGRPASSDDSAMEAAVSALVSANITVVVSAGNDRTAEIEDKVPAGFAAVMAVASTTAQDGSGPNKGRCSGMQVLADTASMFTTDGAEVAISAPGNSHEDISKGCSMQGTGILSLQLGGGTTRKSGTSMASPHVAGVVALLLEKNTNLTPAGVRSAIGSSADRIDAAPLGSPVSGYTDDGKQEGVLDAAGALALVP